MELIIGYFQILLLLSIPQAYVHFRFTLAIWRFKPSLFERKIILFSVLSSIIVDLDILHVPALIHMVSYFFLTLIIFYWLFRSFGYKKILILYFSFSIFVMLVELTCAMLIEVIYGLDSQKDMFLNHLPRLLSVFMPVLLVLYLLSRYMEKRRFIFFRQLYQYLLNLNQARMKEILFLTFFQAFLLGVLFVIRNENKNGYMDTTFKFLIYFLVCLTFCAFFYTLRLLVRTQKEAVRQTQDVYVSELGKVLTSIRGQRHDFLNHVQVMSSMLKMNKLDRLKAYMDEIVTEAHTFSEILSHSSPALAAFIQTKMEIAITRNISFTYDIPQGLDIEASIKSIDMVKIMGNLVDNAFDESDTLPSERRFVHLSIQVVAGQMHIGVRNQGRLLSETEIRKLTLPGYTTKKSGHSGLGLAIVKERVQHYKGFMVIDSCKENGTTIQVTLPHRNSVA